VRRFRRRLLKTLLVLPLVAGAAFQALLWTDWPRRVAVATASDLLGARVEARALRVHWWARRVVLEDVRLGLPLAEAQMLSAGRVTLRHANPFTLLTGGFEVERVGVDGLDLALREDAEGGWNALELLDRLPAGGGAPQGYRMAWPALVIRGARVHVHRHSEAPVVLEEVNLSGRRRHGVRYAWKLETGAGLAARGRVGAGPDFAHELTFDLEAAPALVKRFAGPAAGTLIARGRWRGRVEASGLRGRLELGEARFEWGEGEGAVAGVGVSGDLKVMAGEEVVLEPRALALGWAGGAPRLQVSGGRVVIGSKVRIERLDVEAREGSATLAARVNGRLDGDAISGALEASWAGTFLENGAVIHRGTLGVQARRPTTRSLDVQVRLESRGRSPWGRWRVAASAGGAGEPAGLMEWKFDLDHPRFVRAGGAVYGLEGLTGRLEQVGLDLREIAWESAGEGRMGGTGAFHLGRGTWEGSVTAESWGAELLGAALDLELAAEGAPGRVSLARAEAEAMGLRLEASGDYRAGRAEPLAFEVTLASRLRSVLGWLGATGEAEGGATEAGEAGGAAAVAASAGAAGSGAGAGGALPPPDPGLPAWDAGLRWEGRVSGRPASPVLEAGGVLEVNDWVARHRPLGRVRVPLSLRWEAGSLSARSEAFELLGAGIEMEAAYTLGRRTLAAKAAVTGAELAPFSVLLPGEPPLAGRAAATLDITLPLDDLTDLSVDGAFEAEALSAGGLEADRAEGQLHTRWGVIRLDPVRLWRGAGRAEGRASYDLERFVRSRLTLQDWPVPLAPAMDGQASGTARLTYDTHHARVRGSADTNVALRWHGEAAGRLDLRGRLEQEQLAIEHVEGELFGGRVSGAMQFPLDRLMAAEGTLTAEGVDLGRVPAAINDTLGLEGALSGRLSFAPTTAPRAIEPLRIDLEMAGAHLRVRRMALPRVKMAIFAGPDRVVLEESEIGFVGGTVRAWASLRPREGGWFTHLRTDLERLELAPIGRTWDPEGDPLVGRLSGRAEVTGFPGHWPHWGRARLTLTESDLVGNDIVSGIFSLAGIRFNDRTPQGEGEVALRMEGRSLAIDRFEYFNRGTQLYGAIEVKDLGAGAASPVGGYAVAVQHVLRKLPLPALMDEAMAALQAGGTTVEVGGTLEAPELKPVAFGALSEPVRALLQGE